MESEWKNPYLLEMKVADIISRQAKHGTQFNIRNAQWLIHSLNEKIVVIDSELIPLLPKMRNKGTEYKKPFKMNGDFMKFVGEYAERVGLKRREVGGPFTAIWYTPFDPGKTARVKDVMLDMGWMPTEWNIKKMPFQTFKYRKRLERMTYEKFINEWDREEAVFMDGLVNDFIQAHFVNKSKGYMKAVLVAIGFDLKKGVPTFDQIKKKLLLKPFWPTTPQITEDSFDSLSEEDGRALTLLKHRMMLSHRRSFLQGLVEKYNERGDGKLSGEANPCATPTARFRHKIIVNVPAAGALLGKECRSLFTGDKDASEKALVIKYKFEKLLKDGEITDKDIEWSRNRYFWDKAWHPIRILIPEGYQAFVGYDGAGLELRMLCHFMIAECKEMLEEAISEGNASKKYRAEEGLKSAYLYREVLLEGDIHTHNMKLAGLPTRKAAKSFIYGFNYGAGNAKLGELVGGGAEEGAIIRETFLRENPCIAILIERTQEKGQLGFIYGLDGRKLFLRTDPISGEPMTHKALNLKLQSAGAIVMKYAMCFLDNWAKKLNAHKVIDMHDEGQWTCAKKDITELAGYMSNCVAKAGEYLKMECELASDALIGANWYHTH